MADAFQDTTELLKRANSNLDGINVDDLLLDAPVLRRVYAKGSSHETQHLYLKRTSAPAVGFRDVNTGVENTKGVRTLVTRDLKLIDASFAMDMALASKLPKGTSMFDEEAVDHLQSALADLEKQMIYGTGTDSDGFEGIGDVLDDSDDAMVVDAGGTTANTGSSVFMIRTGEADFAMAYGQGGTITLGDPYETTIEDATNGGRYAAWYTPQMVWATTQLGSVYTVGRICNLTGDAGKGLTDDLLSSLYEKFPAGRKPNLIAATRRSVGQLQRSRTTYNPTGRPADVPEDYMGIPIVVTDQISDTEALLTASS